jgi:hypothetical protein
VVAVEWVIQVYQEQVQQTADQVVLQDIILLTLLDLETHLPRVHLKEIMVVKVVLVVEAEAEAVVPAQ